MLAKTSSGRLLQYFLRGLVLIVPFALTLFLVYWFLDRMDGILRPFVPTRGMGLIALLAIILATGWFSSFFLIKRIYSFLDSWLERMPVINFIYSSTRDFLEAFAGKKRRFTQAVLVSVLADEVWLVGFLTDENLEEFNLGAKYVAVYVPQAYNVAGQLYLVKRERVRPIDHLASADIMKYAVSGGAVELVTNPKAQPAPVREPAPVAAK
jgi:uncharacterized membrane protein